MLLVSKPLSYCPECIPFEFESPPDLEDSKRIGSNWLNEDADRRYS